MSEAYITAKPALPLPIDYIYRGFTIAPQATAAEDEHRSLSYAELQQHCEALALALQQQVKPGDRIALCAQNHIDHLISFIAILMAGCIWVPINPKNGSSLNQKLLQKSQPALVLVDQPSEATLGNNSCPRIYLGQKNAPSIRQLIDQHKGKAFSPHRAAPSDIMAIKFTGGTTGEPKGVMQSHNNVAAVVENMQAIFSFQASDGNLAVAPLTHGGSHYILPILAVGAKHVLLSAPKPEKIVSHFANGNATVSFMPPTLIYKLIEQPGISRDDFKHLRHLTYSAAPMPAEKVQQVIELIGPKLSTVYGQTEAPMTITAMNNVDMSKAELQASVGKACLFSDIAIIGNDGEFLEAGQTGEIAVSGEIVMSGYYQEPEKTAAAMQQGYLLTGDLGYIDPQGYLFLQGRAKELMISGGFNVYPAEVENAIMDLASHYGIRECCVFSQADEYWGERIEVALCLNSGITVDVQKLSHDLKQAIGSVKSPKEYHILSDLPRNPVGKVVRREVKALIENQS